MVLRFDNLVNAFSETEWVRSYALNCMYFKEKNDKFFLLEPDQQKIPEMDSQQIQERFYDMSCFFYPTGDGVQRMIYDMFEFICSCIGDGDMNDIEDGPACFRAAGQNEIMTIISHYFGQSLRINPDTAIGVARERLRKTFTSKVAEKPYLEGNIEQLFRQSFLELVHTCRGLIAYKADNPGQVETLFPKQFAILDVRYLRKWTNPQDFVQVDDAWWQENIYRQQNFEHAGLDFMKICLICDIENMAKKTFEYVKKKQGLEGAIRQKLIDVFQHGDAFTNDLLEGSRQAHLAGHVLVDTENADYMTSVLKAVVYEPAPEESFDADGEVELRMVTNLEEGEEREREEVEPPPGEPGEPEKNDSGGVVVPVLIGGGILGLMYAISR